MNFIPLAKLPSRKHKNGKTITASSKNITATFDTESSYESLSSTQEVGNSSRAANDSVGGQAPSRSEYEDESEHQDHHHLDQHLLPDEDHHPSDTENSPVLLRDFPEYSLETKLLDVDPNHYGILASLSNSITFIPEKYVRKTRKVFSMYMQRVIDDPTELNWKKFFLLATILFDNDSTRLLKDRKSLLLSRLVSLERDEWNAFTH